MVDAKEQLNLLSEQDAVKRCGVSRITTAKKYTLENLPECTTQLWTFLPDCSKLRVPVLAHQFSSISLFPRNNGAPKV